MTYNTNDSIKKAQDGNKNEFDSLVISNMGLVKSIAKRFIGRGTEFEDLVQIGCIGLIKAIENFDISVGTQFSTYAVPLISGEIKKHLRDDGAIKISREIKRDAINVTKKRQEFIKEHGEEPSVSELAEICGLDEESVVTACEAASPLISFSEPQGETTLENLVGFDNIAELCEKISLRQALAHLEATDREIIKNRYFLGKSQKETGQILGMTQVMVSRREKKIIEELRLALT